MRKKGHLLLVLVLQKRGVMENKDLDFAVVISLFELQVIGEVIREADSDTGEPFNSPCVECFREPEAFNADLRVCLELVGHAFPQSSSIPSHVLSNVVWLAHQRTNISQEQPSSGVYG